MIQRFPRFSTQKSWDKRPAERRSRSIQRFPSARIFRAIPTCIFPALWYNRKVRIRVQRGCFGRIRLRVQCSCLDGMHFRVQCTCFGGMHLWVQCSCFGSAVAVSGTGQSETPQSLVTPAFAGLSPIAESGTKMVLTTGLTTDRKIFDFPPRRGIMAEIEYPGIAKLVSRLVWDQETVRSSRTTRTKIPLKSLISEGFFFFDYCGAGFEEYLNCNTRILCLYTN